MFHWQAELLRNCQIRKSCKPLTLTNIFRECLGPVVREDGIEGDFRSTRWIQRMRSKRHIVYGVHIVKPFGYNPRNVWLCTMSVLGSTDAIFSMTSTYPMEACCEEERSRVTLTCPFLLDKLGVVDRTLEG